MGMGMGNNGNGMGMGNGATGLAPSTSGSGVSSTVAIVIILLVILIIVVIVTRRRNSIAAAREVQISTEVAFENPLYDDSEGGGIEALYSESMAADDGYMQMPANDSGGEYAHLPISSGTP